MIVLMFQPQFADLVAQGFKKQTIRGVRKRPIKEGDLLSLRKWNGAPYRSKQTKLSLSQCEFVFPIRITKSGITRTDEGTPTALDRSYIAKKDGFGNWQAMKSWFQKTHGLPFDGVLIKW